MPYAPKTFHERTRGTPAQRGYDRDWYRVRDQRRLLNPFCQHCEQRGKLVLMAIADHIIPVSVRPDLRLELDNTQSLCRRCHAIKTECDARQYGKM